MNGQDAASFFTEVPLAPGDPIFAVAGAYKKSADPNKVNVSIGGSRGVWGSTPADRPITLQSCSRRVPRRRWQALGPAGRPQGREGADRGPDAGPRILADGGLRAVHAIVGRADPRLGQQGAQGGTGELESWESGTIGDRQEFAAPPDRLLPASLFREPVPFVLHLSFSGTILSDLFGARSPLGVGWLESQESGVGS